MKKSAFIFIIVVFFCVITSPVAAQVEEIEPTRGLYYYSGTLSQQVKIEFNLQFNGSQVSGSYILEETGDMFVFNGRMSNDRKGIGVLVYNTNNLYVASIEATFTNEEGNFGKLLSGKWKSADGSQYKLLKLKKVAEFAEGPTLSPVLGEFYGE